MLIISRKRNEAIVFVDKDGNTFQVIVRRIRGHKVEFAIDAPKEVQVRRSEVKDGK